MTVLPMGGDGTQPTLFTASSTTTGGQAIVFADVSSSSVTITLASADCRDGNRIEVIDAAGNAGTNSITIDTEGGEDIDGSTSVTISTNKGAIALASDGSTWRVDNKHPAPSGGSSSGGTTTDLTTAPSYTVNPDTDFLFANGSGAQTISLGTTDLNLGDSVTIVDGSGNASSNKKTVDSASPPIANASGGSHTIDDDGGSATFTFTSGGKWRITNEHPAPTASSAGPSLTTLVDGSETGTVAAGNQGVMVIDELADTETLNIQTATLVTGIAEAVPTDVDLVIGTFSGGAFTSQTTVLSGDGSTVHANQDGSPLASYQNTSGGTQTVGLVVDNQSGNSQSVVADAAGEIV